MPLNSGVQGVSVAMVFWKGLKTMKKQWSGINMIQPDRRYEFAGGGSISGKRLSIIDADLSAGYPTDKCIHQLFEDQAKRRPENVAVVLDDKQLTYRQLDESANQLARFLQKKGVKPETLVAVCLDRSLEIVIAIIAVLKAGGAYVPIDPDYPEDRKAFMLEDSGCVLVITQKMFQFNLPQTGAEHLCYDEALPEIAKEAAERVESAVRPHNLAYVIYTSGSTGKPKGVLIENKNVVRLLFNDRFQFDFTENDTWTIFHSFCFDFSVWEMYGALLYGGKAVIIPKEQARDPQTFASILIDQKVTVLNQTPSAFYHLIPKLMELSVKGLCIRYVVFGGEKLNPRKLAAIQPCLPKTKFINMYGITETTVHVTYKEITQEDIEKGFSNIGKPIPTLSVFIVDDRLRVVPEGVEGELCVGGAGVARGYLNRPQLTAEKFIGNPHNPEEIIYRSGDLACLHESGDLEYFGRMDHQIQLRGFRIELGEVEAVIMAIDGIEDCAVVPHEDSTGDVRLVAYVIFKVSELSAEKIRAEISRQLPDYMVPTFFIKMDRFPLTSNGKLDNKKLPAPDIAALSTAAYVAPKTSVELELACIWSKVLGIAEEKISLQHNFFEIGGHSLSVVMLTQYIREKFQKAVTIEHVYENPKFEDLCRVVLQLDAFDDSDDKLSDDDTRTNVLPLLSPQLICWWVKYLLKINTSNVCDVFLLEGIFDLNAFEQAAGNAAKRHDSLWHPFSPSKPVIQLQAPAQFTLDFIDISDKASSKEDAFVKDLILKILHTSFDLTQVPLFKLTVIKQAEQRHLLLAAFPHIVSDVASLNDFVRETLDLYNSLRRNGTKPKGLRRTSARELIKNENDYFKSESYLKDMNFWREKFQNSQQLILKKEYFIPKGEPTGRKLVSKVHIDQDKIARLLELSVQTNVSIQMIIFALIHATFHTLSGQNDVTIKMVCDIRGLYPYPPVSNMNSTVINVRSMFTGETTYLKLLSDIKWFVIAALNHIKLPASILLTLPLLPVLKKRPLFALAVRILSFTAAWHYRKTKMNREIIKAQISYFIGTIASIKNVKILSESLSLAPPVAYNVLPDFFENRTLWSNDALRVTSLRDRELMMDPHVFEENSKYQDAVILNIDLVKDSNDEAYLYLWGGRFTPEALSLIQEIFNKHMAKIIENPSVLIDP